MGLRAEGNDDRGAARLLTGPAAATRQGPLWVESGPSDPSLESEIQHLTSEADRQPGKTALVDFEFRRLRASGVELLSELHG